MRSHDKQDTDHMFMTFSNRSNSNLFASLHTIKYKYKCNITSFAHSKCCGLDLQKRIVLAIFVHLNFSTKRRHLLDFCWTRWVDFDLQAATHIRKIWLGAKTRRKSGPKTSRNTVDGRNPANHPGMYKTGINYQPQPVSRISEPSANYEKMGLPHGKCPVNVVVRVQGVHRRCEAS